MRLVGAGSELLARAAPADELGCCCDAAWPSGRARDSSHHSWLALEPSMALGSFSLSLLIQVHEAAAVVASGGDAGDEWRPLCDAAVQRTAAARRGRFGQRS